MTSTTFLSRDAILARIKDYLVNHVIFVLDASTSMKGSRAEQLIKAVTAEIENLAHISGSDELNQETRVTVYDFADTAQCIVPERDVMRLPDIGKVYNAYGNTALVAATLLALDDIEKIRKGLIYGNHAFLVYVLTDGEENRSNAVQRAQLHQRLAKLPDDVTVAALVPEGWNYMGGLCIDDTVKLGFPRGNVATWNINASDGVEKAVGSTMRAATTSYFQARATGLRSTDSLFSMSASTVNKQTVTNNLDRLDPDDYKLIHITPPPADYANGAYWWIKDFAEFSGYLYSAGETGYYKLAYVKGKKPSEVISPTKKIIIVEKSTGIAYGGKQARQLLGLPDDKSVRVRYDHNPDYDIYVLSSANNRHLLHDVKDKQDAKVLLWKPVKLNKK